MGVSGSSTGTSRSSCASDAGAPASQAAATASEELPERTASAQSVAPTTPSTGCRRSCATSGRSAS